MNEAALRVDLAAAFRLVARFGWHESVGNHFSAALPDGRFLLNPKWRHFSAIRASDLLALDVDDDPLEGPDAPDASAWTIHGALHRARPDIAVVLHCHPPNATALAALEDPSLPAIDMNTARFHGDLAIDPECGGIADDAGEGARIAAALGDRSVLLMANHGLTCTGPTVAAAFESLYFFEKAAGTYLTALATGRPLSIMSNAVARHTAKGWHAYAGMADAHFAHWKSVMDREDADYAS